MCVVSPLRPVQIFYQFSSEPFLSMISLFANYHIIPFYTGWIIYISLYTLVSIDLLIKAFFVRYNERNFFPYRKVRVEPTSDVSLISTLISKLLLLIRYFCIFTKRKECILIHICYAYSKNIIFHVSTSMPRSSRCAAPFRVSPSTTRCGWVLLIPGAT